jgi:NADPH-dependent curcumin reductase CurA
VNGGINRQIVLKSHPTTLPTLDNFELKNAPVPAVGPGQFLVRNLFAAADPAMRGWISTAKNYAEPVPLGGVMRGRTIARVTDSKHPEYKTGEYLYGLFGWQDFAVSDGSNVWRRIDPKAAPLPAYLGMLGLTGFTAWYGMEKLGEPKPGETLVVSTAAGSVGSIAGQIGKIKGCRTVGLTGSDEKVRLCREEFGYDEVINYKTCGSIAAALKTACPKGIDIYFDNVGGETLDAVLGLLNPHGRVAICGTISVTTGTNPTGPRVERTILVTRARVQGFLILDHFDHFEEAVRELTGWYRAGKLHYREDMVEGLENAPAALLRVLSGANLGRQLIRIAPDAA